MPDLTGQVCVITGAAGRIGRACVARFLEAGARVIAVDIVQADIEGVPAGDYVKMDQGNPSHLSILTQCLQASNTKHIDVLVNNGASGGNRAPFHEKTLAEYDEVMETNVKGPLLLSQLAIKMHLAQPEADRHELSIVNITSTAGHRATDQASIYSMSKHALIGMTKNVAVEYAALGVRCNSVSPGIMEVPNVQGFSPDQMKAMTSKVPMQRGGKPSEVANVVCFLASAEASYITGTDVLVTGGSTA